MGRMWAAGMAEAARAEAISNQVALFQHLRYNLYPPLPGCLAGICEESIQAMCEGDFEKEISMPKGVLWRGQETATASQIAESCRLEGFIMYDDNE